jgi:hypothetical protein
MKTIKSLLPFLLIAILVAVSSPIQAQEKKQDEEGKRFKHRSEKFEKMRSMKIAFITESVDLTPEEAEKFWPVYNEFDKQRGELTHLIMERYHELEEKKNEDKEITDEEALEMMQRRFELEERIRSLELEYFKKYLEILSPNKVLKLYEAEDRFKKQLIDRIGQRDGERRTQGRGISTPHRGNRSFRR